MSEAESGVVDPERVRDCLRGIVDPCSAATGSNLNVVEMGLIKEIEISGGHVDVEMHLTTPLCHMIPYFKKEAEERICGLEGVETVELTTDDGTEWTEEYLSEAAARKRQAVLDEQRAKYEREMVESGEAPEESASDA